MKSPKVHFIFTCEHAGYIVPKLLLNKVEIPQQVLSSHMGYDRGAQVLAKGLAKKCHGELFEFNITRLLIDANRSLNAKTLHSKYTKNLNKEEREFLVGKYLEYRETVGKSLKKSLEKNQKTFVFSIHTFTPRYKGQIRKTDIGILFRPKIKKENQLATELKALLQDNCKKKWNIHLNRPYRGHTDCFLNDLSDKYISHPRVTGLFLEANQRILFKKEGEKECLLAFSKSLRSLSIF